jgi:hypothetical protein
LLSKADFISDSSKGDVSTSSSNGDSSSSSRAGSSLEPGINEVIAARFGIQTTGCTTRAQQLRQKQKEAQAAR